MPRSEKAKLTAEILTSEQDIKDSQMADLLSLAKLLYDAYQKNFNMNKLKARGILTGKGSNPVSHFLIAVLPPETQRFSLMIVAAFKVALTFPELVCRPCIAGVSSTAHFTDKNSTLPSNKYRKLH